MISNDVLGTVTWHKDDTQLTIAQKIKAGKDTADFIGKLVVVAPLIMDVNPTFGASSQFAMRVRLAKSLVPRFGKNISKLVKNLNLGKFVKKIGDYEVFENGEVFYRAIPQNQLDDLIKTGKIQAGTETFTSPTLEYIKQKGYEGVIIKFHMEKGTLDELIKIGVRNDATREMISNFPKMKPVKDVNKWMETNALFKTEGTRIRTKQINIGLGRGIALDKFNDRIINFEIIK